MVKYINKSSVSVFVDRVAFDFWFGQPLAEGSNIMPCEIKAKQTLNDIRLHCFLNDLQKEYIQKKIDERHSFTNVIIHMDFYCICKIGNFSFRVSKELPLSNAVV